MKASIYIISLVLFCGCELGNKVKSRRYILENGTNREIKIDCYAYGIYQDTGFIRGTGVIIESITDDGGFGKALNPTFYGGSDSIIVTFDNKKRQLYYLDDGYKAIPNTSNNILNNDAYIIENDELYRFTFTEEDYENAEEI